MMNKNILIVIACKEESCGLFETFDNVLFTGVGKINAAYNLTRKIYELRNNDINLDLVLNFGSVGSDKFKRGDLVYCRKFIQHDMNAVEFGYELGITPGEDNNLILEHKRIVYNLQEAICGTGDCFSSDFYDIVDVADMESYALAKVCKKEKIDFCSIKYVTNNFNSGDAFDWDEECKIGAKKMFDYFNANFK